MLLCAFLSIAAVHLLRKCGAIRFYEPTYIQVHVADSTAIHGIFGITPGGRKISFEKSESTYHIGYGFLRQIGVSLEPGKLRPGDQISIISGSVSNKIHIYSIVNFLESDLTDTCTLTLLSPSGISSNDSSLEFLLTIRYWQAGKIFLGAIGGVLLLLLLYFLYKDLRPVRINRKFVFRSLLLLSGIVSLILFAIILDLNHIPLFSGFLLLWALGVFVYFSLLGILHKKSSLLKKMYLLTSVIFILLFGLETVLRFSSLQTYSEIRTGYYVSPYQPQINSWYYTLQPNKTYYLESPEFRYLRKTNILGLSGEIFPAVKKRNEIRILALGDSFTEGDGADADSTWLSLLRNSLSLRYPQNHFQTMNAGVGGSDPFFEYVLLRDKLLKYNPDLVIVAMGADLEDVMVRGGMERFSAGGKLKYQNPPWWEWIYSSLFSFRLLSHNMGYNQLLMNDEHYRLASSESIAELRYVMRLFELLSLRNRFELVFAIYPLRDEVIQKEYKFWDLVLKDPALDSMHTVDLLDAYLKKGMNEDNLGTFYWIRDGHHNARGYEVFSDVLFEYIEEKHFIEKILAQEEETQVH